MKKFWNVFQFEVMTYIKNKSFMIMTFLLAILLGLGSFLPRVFDMSDMLGIESEKKDDEDKKEKEKTVLGIVDETGYFTDLSALAESFKNTEFVSFASEQALVDAVKKAGSKESSDKAGDADEAGENPADRVSGGFYVIDDLHYRYYVWNRNMTDANTQIFDSLLSVVHKQVYCAEHDIDYAGFVAEYDAPVQSEEEILGKDAFDNFWYCYALVIIIFMVIVLYGVMIATAVTTEKSNRSIEVLVTSIDSTYLLFGKVFAGTVAVVFQLGIILGSALLGYSVNHAAWGDKLDMIFNIPSDVLLNFAIFGIGGFLFYAFLYGAMGALVSKTEDINQTAGPLQMIIMMVYFVVLLQLNNTDGIVMKVCSFLPFSSYSAMFARIGMGQVAVWEIVLSAVILYASVFFVGWLAAKIYRMGTLRYGNPIKLGKALKDLF